MPRETDIIIIGGGFAGLTCAVYLSKIIPSLSIILLEKNDILGQDKARDGRAFAISKKSLQIFEKIGIAEKLTEIAGKITDIRITDGQAPIFLHFDGNNGDNSEIMGLVIENFHIHNQLRDQAVKLPNLKIIAPTEYQKIDSATDKITVTLENSEQIHAKLLIAADGRNSLIREQMGIGVFRHSYHQNALVFNIAHQHPHFNIAQERFLPDGPFAILPMQGEHQSSIVWTTTPDMAQTLLQLDEENFLHQLKKCTTDYLGDLRLITKPFQYPLNLCLAKKYHHQRLALIGDAAHAIHPIAGQGFNLGIDDIAVLTDLIHQYSQAGLDIGCFTLLDSYQKKRRLPIYQMAAATHGLNRLFSNDILPVKMARDLGLWTVEKLPILKKFFIKNAGGALK